MQSETRAPGQGQLEPGTSAVTLDRASDTLKPGGTADQAHMFTARYEHRVASAGHSLPQEAPAAFADTVLTVRKWLRPHDASRLPSGDPLPQHPPIRAAPRRIPRTHR